MTTSMSWNIFFEPFLTSTICFTENIAYARTQNSCLLVSHFLFFSSYYYFSFSLHNKYKIQAKLLLGCGYYFLVICGLCICNNHDKHWCKTLNEKLNNLLQNHFNSFFFFFVTFLVLFSQRIHTVYNYVHTTLPPSS